MKITVIEKGTIQLEEVFNSIVLKTGDGEEMVICMRDSGFEFKYQGKWYFAKEGCVDQFHTITNGNPLPQEERKEDSVASIQSITSSVGAMERKRCPDCGDLGWVYDKRTGLRSICPCHY